MTDYYQAINARKEALERALARRTASRSTSERQADYLTGGDRQEEEAGDERPRRSVGETWGDSGEREQSGDRASRRQAAQITRHSSRGDS